MEVILAHGFQTRSLDMYTKEVKRTIKPGVVRNIKPEAEEVLVLLVLLVLKQLVVTAVWDLQVRLLVQTKFTEVAEVAADIVVGLLLSEVLVVKVVEVLVELMVRFHMEKQE